MIGVPWRGGDPWRERCWAYVEQHLARSGYRVEVADDGSDPFSRSGSRNRLVTLAGPDEVVVFHDADMVAPLDAYTAMHDIAASTGRMVVGFDQYRALDRAGTTSVLDGADPFTVRPIGATQGWSVGGIFAVRRDAWERVGGMDPRFQGWGCEDFAFSHAAAVILGPLERLDTPAVHLWHPHGTSITPADVLDANGDLLADYTACRTEAEIREVQCGSLL